MKIILQKEIMVELFHTDNGKSDPVWFLSDEQIHKIDWENFEI